MPTVNLLIADTPQLVALVLCIGSVGAEPALAETVGVAGYLALAVTALMVAQAMHFTFHLIFRYRATNTG